MRVFLYAIFLSAWFLFAGCSSKQYFEPKKTYKAPAKSYGGEIIGLSRDGATLRRGNYIGKYGLEQIYLGKGYRFLSENRHYVLATNVKGVLKVISKKSKKMIHTVSFEFPVVSASIKNGLIAYVLNNNTFGLYNIKSKKKILESPSEIVYAIDTRAPSPVFIDNLAVIPMLDGKLVIVDVYNTDNAKVVYLSSYDAFNNIIYLARKKNTLIAATPKKVMTLGDSGQHEYFVNISEIVGTSGYIYIFTKEGEIIRLTHTLKTLDVKKFKFAHFSTATVYNNRVYALDQKGSLIVLSADLSKYKIYDIGEVKAPVFISDSKLYKDGQIIMLSKLGYE